MILGKFPPHNGERAPLNEWYIGLDVRKHPSYMSGRGLFLRPWVQILFVKFLDYGEPGVFNGREPKKVGGWWTWTCPYGISIEITH